MLPMVKLERKTWCEQISGNVKRWTDLVGSLVNTLTLPEKPDTILSFSFHLLESTFLNYFPPPQTLSHFIPYLFWPCPHLVPQSSIISLTQSRPFLVSMHPIIFSHMVYFSITKMEEVGPSKIQVNLRDLQR